MVTALLVLICGGAGAIARFALDALVQSRRPDQFPAGTLAVNTSGCLLLGLLAGLHASHGPMLVLGTATLGSYTTFSTWMLETHRPAQQGESRLAWQNIAVSLTIGFAATLVGRGLGGWL